MGQQPSLTIINARIFDGTRAELVEGGVRIVDGIVAEAGPSVTGSGAADGDGGQVVDASYNFV